MQRPTPAFAGSSGLGRPSPSSRRLPFGCSTSGCASRAGAALPTARPRWVARCPPAGPAHSPHHGRGLPSIDLCPPLLCRPSLATLLSRPLLPGRHGAPPELSDALALEHFTDGLRLRDQRLSAVAATFGPRGRGHWQRHCERDYVLLPPLAPDLALVPPPRPPPAVQLRLSLQPAPAAAAAATGAASAAAPTPEGEARCFMPAAVRPDGVGEPATAPAPALVGSLAGGGLAGGVELGAALRTTAGRLHALVDTTGDGAATSLAVDASWTRPRHVRGMCEACPVGVADSLAVDTVGDGVVDTVLSLSQLSPRGAADPARGFSAGEAGSCGSSFREESLAADEAPLPRTRAELLVTGSGAPAQRIALGRLVAEMRRLLPIRLGPSTFARRVSSGEAGLDAGTPQHAGGAPAALIVRLLQRPKGLLFVRPCAFRARGGSRAGLLEVWRAVTRACDAIARTSGAFMPLDSPAAVATRPVLLLYCSLGAEPLGLEDGTRSGEWRRSALSAVLSDEEGGGEGEGEGEEADDDDGEEETEDEETEGEETEEEEDGYGDEGMDWGSVWAEGEGEGPGDLQGRRDGARADAQRLLRLSLWRRQWRWPLQSERAALALVGLLRRARTSEGWWCADEASEEGESAAEGEAGPEGGPVPCAGVHMCHAARLAGGGACLLQYVARATRALRGSATEPEARRLVEVNFWVEPSDAPLLQPRGGRGREASPPRAATLFWRLAAWLAESDAHLAGGVACTVGACTVGAVGMAVADGASGADAATLADASCTAGESVSAPRRCRPAFASMGSIPVGGAAGSLSAVRNMRSIGASAASGTPLPPPSLDARLLRSSSSSSLSEGPLSPSKGYSGRHRFPPPTSPPPISPPPTSPPFAAVAVAHLPAHHLLPHGRRPAVGDSRPDPVPP